MTTAPAHAAPVMGDTVGCTLAALRAALSRGTPGMNATEAVDDGGLNAESTIAGERLTGELEQDASVTKPAVVRHGQRSPTLSRAKRATSIFSPVREETSVMSCSIVLSGSFTKACSRRQNSW